MYVLEFISKPSGEPLFLPRSLSLLVFFSDTPLRGVLEQGS